METALLAVVAVLCTGGGLAIGYRMGVEHVRLGKAIEVELPSNVVKQVDTHRRHRARFEGRRA